MTDRPITLRANWFLLGLSALALLAAVWSSVQGQAYARCQAMVNESQSIAQRERAAAADQDRQADQQESAATAALIRSVFTSGSRAQSLTAYATYKTTLDDINARRADTDQQRRAHPLPALPSETCG